jgi:hypothetical protein
MQQNYRNFAKLLTTLAKQINRWNWAYYIGGQETANRLEAQALKNREHLLKIEERANKLVLQDIAIENQQIETERRQLENEERKLKIEKLRRELGITAGSNFTATEYPEPGNIREAERNRK